MAILGRRLDPTDRPVGEPAARPPRTVRGDGDRAASLHVPTGRNGRAYGTGGESSRTAKLTVAAVAAIRADTTTPRAELAARYGVQPKRISEIRHQPVWTGR